MTLMSHVYNYEKFPKIYHMTSRSEVIRQKVKKIVIVLRDIKYRVIKKIY